MENRNNEACIVNILNLPQFNVLKVLENEYDYQIKVGLTSPPSYCPHCGCIANLYKHGGRKQLCMDLPIHAKRVGILINRQRYKCRDCDKTFWERLNDVIDEKRKCTTRLVEFVEKQSLKRTFVSIAEDVGIDEKTVRNIFHDYIIRLEKNVKFETPQWLGIDEIHLMKPRGVFTNIKERTILDILPNRNKETVIKYLSMLPNKDSIQYVTMDMWQPYRDAVKTTLPQAQIIVDKFHVVRMANQALEMIRKDTRSKLSAKARKTLMHDRFILLKRKHQLDERESLILETWISNFEELGKAYVAKESFFELWDYPVHKVSPFTRFKAWESKLPEEIKYAFDPLLKAVGNWREEIFAYFEHPITNAYTESINNLIRVINRVGRGYSFEALRAKILFTKSLYKEKKPKYPKNNFHGSELLDMIPGGLQTPQLLNEKKLYVGVDIDSLVKKLNIDEF